MDVQFSVKKLCRHANPYTIVVWDEVGHPITRSDVRKAVQAGQLFDPSCGTPKTREDHTGRIAWFVVHGWKDPIEVDVGVPSLGCYPVWLIQDGNHRFAAAVFRKDGSITVSPAGDVDIIGRFVVHPEVSSS